MAELQRCPHDLKHGVKEVVLLLLLLNFPTALLYYVYLFVLCSVASCRALTDARARWACNSVPVTRTNKLSPNVDAHPDPFPPNQSTCSDILMSKEEEEKSNKRNTLQCAIKQTVFIHI